MDGPLLTSPFGLSVQVERNLSGGRGCHAAPDWRLSARLRLLSPLNLCLDDYSLLKGVLEHNLAASSPPPPPVAFPVASQSQVREVT